MNFLFSSRRQHTRYWRDWSSDVCSSDLDQTFTDKMLLAEANQWPEDAVQYFGDGDECHMNFHFPLMPRLFMSVRMEDRYPIIDILEQTPPIPADRKSTRLNSSHANISYAVFCLKQKTLTNSH